MSDPDDKESLPAVTVRDEAILRDRFWPKFRRFVGRIPFAEDLAAAYYCAIDPKTPARVRAVLIGAVAYFVVPADMIPDFLAGLGFTDDATVLSLALGVVSGHIKATHRERARTALLRDSEVQDDG